MFTKRRNAEQQQRAERSQALLRVRALMILWEHFGQSGDEHEFSPTAADIAFLERWINEFRNGAWDEGMRCIGEMRGEYPKAPPPTMLEAVNDLRRVYGQEDLKEEDLRY